MVWCNRVNHSNGRNTRKLTVKSSTMNFRLVFASVKICTEIAMHVGSSENHAFMHSDSSETACV